MSSTQQVPPTPNPVTPKPVRTTPAEHAKQAFAPQEIPSPAPKLQGPFVDTSSPSDSPIPPQAPPAPLEPLPDQPEPGVPVIEAQIVLGEDELEKGRQWQQERIERRMKGEYERAGRALHELVEENLSTPLRLNSIRILGSNHTRPSFLSALLAPYLPALPPPSYLSAHPTPAPTQTLRSLLNTTRNITGLLEQFDIFKEVEASLERTPSVLAEKEDVDIVLKVREQSRYFLRTATDIGDGEGNATATARVRNAFGGAETLEGNVSFGTRTKSAFQLRLDTPVNASPTTRADFSVFSAQRDLNYFASCTEGTLGAMARLRTSSRWGYHEFAYEAILRKIGDLAPLASMSIREAAGQSVKSSISHTFIRDTRDDPFLATVGSHLKLKQELAGLGGDANFLKAEGEVSQSRSLGAGYSVSLGLRAGAILPLFGQPTLFPDRFQLGGPTSVRLFRPNSMGPKDNGDYIGGDLHWAAGLSLVTPFPWKPEWPVKGHWFLNAGKLTAIAHGSPTPVQSSLASILTQPSLTAGVGLMYRHSLVRVEANFGVPIAQGKQEGSVKGLQFGLGLSFL